MYNVFASHKFVQYISIIHMIYSVHICKYVISMSLSKQKPGKVLDPAKWFHGRSQKRRIVRMESIKNTMISTYFLWRDGIHSQFYSISDFVTKLPIYNVHQAIIV